MNGTKMTEYTFEVKTKVKVTISGRDTDNNYQKAVLEAVAQLKDEDWEDNMECIYAEEFDDFEDLREAV